MCEDQNVSATQFAMALHGTLFALISALHQEGHLNAHRLLDQMRHSADVLALDGALPAARLIRDQVEVLKAEFGLDEPSFP